jgi:hypothetical protein
MQTDAYPKTKKALMDFKRKGNKNWRLITKNPKALAYRKKAEKEALKNISKSSK